MEGMIGSPTAWEKIETNLSQARTCRREKKISLPGKVVSLERTRDAFSGSGSAFFVASMSAFVSLQ